MDYQEMYRLWCEQVKDEELAAQLQRMANDPRQQEDAFYRDLSFGTGGLRGLLGAGTNRMNLYTVARATRGLAQTVPPDKRAAAVSYDSRIHSDRFARKTAEVLAQNGFRVFLFPELSPTPCLSYAVRFLGCGVGVMITASHNPSAYNGYKVYGADGCQITSRAAREIAEAIQQTDRFEEAEGLSFEEARAKGLISDMPEDVMKGFLREVGSQSLLPSDGTEGEETIVYTPLNGTGLKPVTAALRAKGYRVQVVPEQENPDGHFPTCPRPNPEEREAMERAIAFGKQVGAHLLLATDPDCDRVGIAERTPQGDYRLFSGNETGVLLLDHIASLRKEQGKMPSDPVMMKTIVTTAMAEKVAAQYGIRTVNVLTGFKYIGEQIGRLEQEGREASFVFGMEESYGYLSGGYVRDKDAVGACLLICDMAHALRRKGLTLNDRLEALFRQFGYYLDTQCSFHFEGSAGAAQMKALMAAFRSGLRTIGGMAVTSCTDYAPGVDGLPPSDVLRFCLEGGSQVVVRPSGTEPKLKVYISVCAHTRSAAEQTEQTLKNAFSQMVLSGGNLF